MPAREKLRLREEIFALTKLTHRLGEEAAQSNLQGMERGRDTNKQLLLIVQGCEGLSFVLSALDSAVETDDRAFLLLARDGDALVTSIQKML